MTIPKNPPQNPKETTITQDHPSREAHPEEETAARKSFSGRKAMIPLEEDLPSFVTSQASENNSETEPLSQKVIAVSATTKDDARRSQQIRVTRAHKLLLRTRLDNDRVKAVIINLIKARLKEEGCTPSTVKPQKFRTELINTLIDLDNRGISLGHPALSNQQFSVNLILSEKLAENYHKYHQIDEKLKKFLDSSKCMKWDHNKNLFRGGKYYFESKLTRNPMKQKPPYKPGSINVGMQRYGSGLYVTDQLQEAYRYGRMQQKPGFVRIQTKINTPLIELENQETRTLLQSVLGLKTSSELDLYFMQLCPHPVLLKHDLEPEEASYFTTKSPEIIDNVEIVDDATSWRKASISRLDESTAMIKGHPTQFKEVLIPNGTRMVKLENTIVKWDSDSGDAPVLKFKNAEGVDEYVIESPLDDTIYWAVKPAPHEENIFIVEPCPDFLRARHQDKLDKLTLDGWPESKPAIKTLWNAFKK